MSILGIARELSTLLNIPLKETRISFQETGPKTETLLKINLLDKKQAPLFACRVLQDIQVKESPKWLQKKLQAYGVRSINTPIDIGNLVMLEHGQPLHIFDYDQIVGKTLTVTSHTDHAELITLDEAARNIPPSSILVLDEQGPVSFAGVIGGKRASVSSETRNIIIEAAYFTPEAIRASSKLLSLKTDASLRFEKGVDPSGIEKALNLAASLIQELCGGTLCEGILKEQAHSFEKKRITCRVEKINSLLGTDLSLRDIATFLSRSYLEIESESAHALTVLVPTFRGDLTAEIDLIEEVARVYGYNNIPQKKTEHISSTLTDAPLFLLEKEIRDKMVGFGMQEVVTCDLISPEQAHLSLGNTLSPEALISVLSPSSLEQSVLRASLFPGLLEVVKYNNNHGFDTLHAFEVGRIHFKEKEDYIEYSSLGMILSGMGRPYHIDPKPIPVDFFDLKGILENLFSSLHLPEARFEPSHFPSLHPGKQARIFLGVEPIGILGEIHPKLTREMKFDAPLYFAEVSIDALLAHLPKEKRTKPIIPYPGSERDWTLTVAENVPVSHLLEAIDQRKSPFLEKVTLLDLYKSSQIGKDKKNVTLRFFYRDPSQTIAQNTVEEEHKKVIQAVAELFHLPS